MNIALIIIAVLLLGARRTVAPPTGGTGKVNPNVKTGSITYDGSRECQAEILGKCLSVDYDFRVQIDGFNAISGNPITAYSGGNRSHGSDTWDYSRNTPEKIFNIAWKNYLDMGGDPILNWNVNFTNNYYEYAKKDAVYDKVLGLLQVFFPNLRTTIEDSIPDDIKENIEIVINA